MPTLIRPNFIILGLFAFVNARASAQPAASASSVVNAEKMVVEETRLSVDAAGTTQVRIDATVPSTDRSWENLADRVANLHVNAGGAHSFGDSFTLRGLANTPFFSDPAVTLYFDDLPLASSFTYPTALFGFADAAIYRGPQATAFGRAGEGGVIVLSSAEPAAQANGEFCSSVGNYNSRSAALTASSARGPKADASVAFAYGERDGYIENTQLRTRVDDQESFSASTRVRVRPTTASEFTLQLLGTRSRDGSQPLVPLNGPYFSVQRGREGSTAIDNFGAAVKGAFDLPCGRLSAVTSYTDWRLDPYDNRLVLPPTLDSHILQTQRTWNEEVRLASARRTDLSWNAGSWFSDSRTNGDVNRAIPGLFPIEVSSYTLQSRTAALFGQAIFSPKSNWHITAGRRAARTGHCSSPKSMISCPTTCSRASWPPTRRTRSGSYLAAYRARDYFPGGYFQMAGERAIGMVEKPGAGNAPSDLVSIVIRLHRDAAGLARELDTAYASGGPDDHYERAISAQMRQHEHAPGGTRRRLGSDQVPLARPGRCRSLAGRHLRAAGRARCRHRRQSHRERCGHHRARRAALCRGDGGGTSLHRAQHHHRQQRFGPPILHRGALRGRLRQ